MYPLATFKLTFIFVVFAEVKDSFSLKVVIFTLHFMTVYFKIQQYCTRLLLTKSLFRSTSVICYRSDNIAKIF